MLLCEQVVTEALLLLLLLAVTEAASPRLLLLLRGHLVCLLLVTGHVQAAGTQTGKGAPYIMYYTCIL